jgi:hypothetical protein
MGRNPKTKLIVASYAAALAQDFTRWQRNTIESEIYREIFPNCIIESDSRSKQKFDTTEGGTVIGAGVDGPITGRGADLAIIDDPFKNYEEAMSELQQEKVWEWYRSTLYTRLHPGAKIIIPMTRWHTNDLAGRLLAAQPGNWHLLKLPALNEKMEPLWKERYSLDEYLDFRENSGDKIFSALYQQEPIDIKERLFDDPKYEEAPKGLKTFAYLDPAFGGNDFSALTIGAIETKNEVTKIYILFGEIWKTQIDETYTRVVKSCLQYDVSTLYCESNQAQVVIAKEFVNRGLFVREIKNTINKHLRIVNSIKTNWSKLYFSNSISENYIKQILNYSEHARFDDAPDSLAGLLEQFKQTSTAINKRYSFWNWL